MDVFNIISGTCSIVGLILSCISFAKITQIHNKIKINQTVDKSIKISQTLDKSDNVAQKGFGIGIKNIYRRRK